MLMAVSDQIPNAPTDYTRFKVTAIKAKEALMKYDSSQPHLLLLLAVTYWEHWYLIEIAKHGDLNNSTSLCV